MGPKGLDWTDKELPELHKQKLKSTFKRRGFQNSYYDRLSIQFNINNCIYPRGQFKAQREEDAALTTVHEHLQQQFQVCVCVQQKSIDEKNKNSRFLSILCLILVRSICCLGAEQPYKQVSAARTAVNTLG